MSLGAVSCVDLAGDKGKGQTCQLEMDFCLYGVVQGNILKSVVAVQHQFGYDREGQDVLYRLSAGFRVDPIVLQSCSLFSVSCDILKLLQDVFNSTGIDAGTLLSPELAKGVQLWPPTAAFPGSFASGSTSEPFLNPKP